jgi:hypothetical protein
MAPPRETRVVATGIVFEEPADPARAFVDALGLLTQEARRALDEARAGHVLLLTFAPFADVDAADGGGVRRYRLALQGPYAVDTSRSATATLLGLVGDHGEDLLAALAIAGVTVSRFDFYAAPHTLELDESIRRRLRLD